MDLWIRSQDKKLLCKCDSLFIEEELYKRKGKYKIMANNGWLGEYNKLERALEVLDEIQRTIAKNQGLISLMHNFIDLEGNEDDITQLFKDMIYEMPKE